MKLTGERPIEGSTPDSLIALHEAGYREVAARLGPGIVLDIGCGVGDATMRLSASDRFVIGIDYDAPTAIGAQARYGSRGNVAFGAMDGSRLGLRDHTIDWVCSSHVVEHFTQPERHVAELARLVAPEGTVFVLTPNHPADFENPFHVYDFEPPQLDSLLRLFFDDVTVLGLDGDDAFADDFARRRASGERLLRIDRLELRKHLPRRTYVWAYERVLPMVYRVLGSKTSGIGSGIDDSHLYVHDSVARTTPVLFAIARKPRARVARLGIEETQLRTLVCIPTYNEIENIEIVLRRTRAAAPTYDILVLDDNSRDGTAERARAVADELGQIEVLVRPGKAGLGAAYRAGFLVGRARGYEILCEMDADLSHQPEALPKLVGEVEQGAALAIGSRYVPGGAMPNWPARRLALSRWGNRYVHVVLGLPVKDSTAGFRAFRSTILDAIHHGETRGEGYLVQVETAYKVHQVGGRIVEVPITFIDRERGTSKMSSRIVAEAMLAVTWWGLRDRILRRRRAHAS